MADKERKMKSNLKEKKLFPRHKPDKEAKGLPEKTNRRPAAPEEIAQNLGNIMLANRSTKNDDVPYKVYEPAKLPEDKDGTGLYWIVEGGANEANCNDAVLRYNTGTKPDDGLPKGSPWKTAQPPKIPPKPYIPTSSNTVERESVAQFVSGVNVMDKTCWVIINSIAEIESSANLPLKINDFVLWLDYDPKYILSESQTIAPHKLLECLTWTGESIVVPSSCLRLPSSENELARGLSRRPRASVLNDYNAKSSEELSVKVGEVVYLLKQLDGDYYQVMNKANMRGKLPKNILNVLVEPD